MQVVRDIGKLDESETGFELGLDETDARFDKPGTQVLHIGRSSRCHGATDRTTDSSTRSPEIGNVGAEEFPRSTVVSNRPLELEAAWRETLREGPPQADLPVDGDEAPVTG